MGVLAGMRSNRDVVVARGDDAVAHLQTQLTQDIEALGVGSSAWSFLLEPNGQIMALLRATRTRSTEVTLDVEPGFGDTVRDRLDGFLFRMDVEFSSASWPAVAIRGEGAAVIDAGDAPIHMRDPWPGIAGLDLVGPGVELPGSVESMDPSELDAMRIRLGWPSMADLAGAVPAMTGIVEHTVSFTKGCYTGQELVARMHYRNAVPPRRLVQIGFHPCAQPKPGDEITLDSEVVGELTTISEHQPIALGYLVRKIASPSEATCAGSPACIGNLPVADASVDQPTPTRTGPTPLSFGG